jgi:hypothetical protein
VKEIAMISAVSKVVVPVDDQERNQVTGAVARAALVLAGATRLV